MIGWIRRSPSCWMNPSGYQVSASMLRAVHAYSAWAPDCGKDAHDRLLRTRYAIGQAVPARRQLLGVFFSLEAAMAACDGHVATAAPEPQMAARL